MGLLGRALGGLTIIAVLTQLALTARLLQDYCRRDAPLSHKALLLTAYGVLMVLSGALVGWAAQFMMFGGG